MCFWPSLCLLWRNVCLDLLPIFLTGLFYLFYFIFSFLILMLSCMNCLYVLEIDPLLVASSTISAQFNNYFLMENYIKTTRESPWGTKSKETNVDPEFSEHSVDNGKSSNNWHCYSSTLTWRHSVCIFSFNPYQWQPLDMGILIIILPMRTPRLTEDKQFSYDQKANKL